MLWEEIGTMKPYYLQPRRGTWVMLRWLILAVLFFLLCGCGAARQTGVWISEEDFRNYDAGKEMIETFLLSWPFQSGAIRCGLGANMDKLPADVVKAMDELDTCAALSTDERNDEMLGCALANQVKVKSYIAKYVYEKYVPGLFNVFQVVK